jgi:hypothetical protein
VAAQYLPFAEGAVPPGGKGEVRWGGPHPRSPQFVDNEEQTG